MANAAGLTFDLSGIGLLGPGLAGWPASIAALSDAALWQCQPTIVPPPAVLQPTERRRAGTVTKASVVVADEASRHAGIDPALLVTVFASSGSEPANCHALCEALATPERLVSPTRFTNSVHNAAAGYWHIATHSQQASTSVCAFDASFVAGLLEAAVQCSARQQPVLLVACDCPYPQPMHALRPLADVFAVGLVIRPAGAGGLARLHVTLRDETPATQCPDAGLESLRHGIPAARSLPLLQAIAARRGATLDFEFEPGLALRLDVEPAC